MARSENIIVTAATEFDGKALQRGAKQLTDFEKLTKKLGKTFAATFAAKKIYNFGVSSVQAFVESEKAGKALAGTLNNLGLAYKQPAIDDYLNKLSLQVGIVDEELKPAYNTLLLATRDATKAQDLLQTSLDVSAGSGKDLSSVVAALSKAYVGNNAALQKLGIGLSKAQLSASSFADLQKELNYLFAGQSKSAASGYTGEVAKLTVAWDQLKEAVGKGILSGASTNGNIDQVTASIVKLGDALGVTTGYLVKFTTGWTELFTKDAWTQFFDELRGKKPILQIDAGSDRGGKAKAEDQRKAALAALQSKAAVAQTKAANAQTAAAKAQALLAKSGTILDVQQAEIYAALQNKITDNEKLRLDLELALLTKNATAAYDLAQQLMVSQLQTTDLAKTISSLPKALNPFADWPQYIQDLIKQLGDLAKAIPFATTNGNTSTNPLYKYNSLSQQDVQGTLNSVAQGYGGGIFDNNYAPSTPAYGYNSMPQSTYNINIDATSMVDTNNMTKVVQDAILLINRNGLSTVPAGQGF